MFNPIFIIIVLARLTVRAITLFACSTSSPRKSLYRQYSETFDAFLFAIFNRVCDWSMSVMMVVCYQHNQILDSVIEFIAVDMVNVFIRLKFSMKKLLHNITMFFHSFAVNANFFITPNIYRTSSFRSVYRDDGIAISIKSGKMFRAKMPCFSKIHAAIYDAFALIVLPEIFFSFYSHNDYIITNKGGDYNFCT